MKCPICSDSKMNRLPYEGIPLYHCTGCHGHLLFRDQVDALKRRRDMDSESLESELANVPSDEVVVEHGELRCPKCLGPMKDAPSSKHSTVIWDHCRCCDLVWLDAGELAKIQLERESTPQAQEYENMRERWQNQPRAKMTKFQKELAQRTALFEEAAERNKKPVGILARSMSFLFSGSKDN